MITGERWQYLSPMLDRALDLTPAQQTEWLASLRETDADLAAELEALLDEARVLSSEHFLERGPTPYAVQATLAGQTVGAYTLEAPLGQGGMGSVWQARRSDGRFEGKVAIKFLNAALIGRAGEERFRREGNLLARLTHPHIARLIDAGVSALGQPYLVLELVEGERIDAYCDGKRLPIGARLKLFLEVLAAVAHAHANLIVHRDIKPSNVLVGSDGTVKLLDFGIAKLLEDESEGGEATQLTREAGRALTPEYAAPEQVLGTAVTTATDVYALGVLLYVLLGGQHPAGEHTRSSAALIKSIVDESPLRLSEAVTSTRTLPEAALSANAARRAATPDKLGHVLRGDLDNIVAKALKKDPGERYGSVTAFAEDIRHYLNNQPVSARADSFSYRTSKFVQRHRIPVALATFAFLAMLLGLAGTITQAQRATREAALAEEQRNRADVQARAAEEQRDFALRELSRADAVNDFNAFLLSDAAPSGKQFTAGELLTRAEAIVERQHAGSDATRADMLIAIGSQYRIMDHDEAALRLLNRAYDIARTLPDATTRARAACNLAAAVSRAGEHDRSEALFREGMAQLSDEPQHTLDRIGCLLQGSGVAREGYAAATAIARAQEAQGLLPQLRYPSTTLELRILMDLAESYRMASDYPAAIAMFEQAYARLVLLGRENTETAGTIYNNWALALDASGETLQAEQMLRRAIRISSADGTDKNVSPMVLINLSRTLIDLNRFEEAARYADKAYETARASGDAMIVRDALLVRATIAHERGDDVSTERLLDEVEPRFRSTQPPECACFGTIAYHRALIAQARGDIDGAMASMDRAVAIGEYDTVRRDALAHFLRRRGEMELTLNRLEGARADALRAIRLDPITSVSDRHSSYLGRAYLLLGRVQLASGSRGDAAIALATAARHLRPTLGANHPQTLLAERLAASSLASAGNSAR